MFFQRYKYYILGFLALLTILSWWAVWERQVQNEARIVFFDVGQGDSIFIQDEARHQVLIDGGPGRSILEKLGAAMPFFDHSLDLLILTHPNSDHLAGLVEVLQRYKVEQVLYTGVAGSDPYYQKFQEIIAEKKIPVNFPRAGQRIMLARGAYLEILFPFEDLRGKQVKDLNDISLVCRLVRGDKEYLLMGDAGVSAEKELLVHNVYLKSDVLKVGHHGSKTATSENFLKAVAPKIAVISVGENKYGHPTAAVLERLQNLAVEILRTDEKGDIEY